MSLTLSNTSEIFKTLYTTDRIVRMTYADHPFWAMVEKKEDFYGENFVQSVIYGGSHGRSATFATAVNNIGQSKVAKFVITRSKDYGLAEIDGETQDASEKDVGAFIEAFELEMDSVIDSVTGALARDLYRNGNGDIAVDGTGGTTKVFTLTNLDEIVHFEVGMVLSVVDSAAEVTNSLSVSARTITAVDRDAGTVTLGNLSTNINTDFGITLDSANSLVQEGDYGNKIKGLDAWLPTTPGTLFSVDTTVDPTRLAGIKYDGSGDPHTEVFQNALARAAREKAKPTMIFLTPTEFAYYDVVLGNTVERSDVTVAGVGFPTITIRGQKSTCKLVPDQNAIPGVAFALDMDTWCAKFLKAPIRPLLRDGRSMETQNGSDSDRLRIGYYGQLICKAPGKNMRITLPSVS